MKKTLICILILVLVLALHKIAVTYSGVPPEERTGAPGETSCFVGGCHTLGTLNPPKSGITVLFDNGSSNYLPDSVYNVSVTITDSAQKIFGFQLTALDSNNLKIGDFIMMDTTNTYIIFFNSREYISHFNAWDSNNFGSGYFTWQFRWIAPSVNSGTITFYTAGVAAESLISVPAGNVHTNTLSINLWTNAIPTASDDTAATTEGISVVIDVQNNDSDLDDDSLTTTIISGPNNGTADTLNGDSIQYIPNPGFTGTDTIIYVVCDNGTPPLCDTAIVIITITSSVGLDDIADKGQFMVFPNPASQNIFFIFKEPQPINIILMSLNGQNSFQYMINDHSFKMDVSNIPSGLYILNIDNAFYKKVLINH